MLPASSRTSECVCPWSVLSHPNSRDHGAVAFLKGASTPPGLRLQYCSFQAFLLRELPQRAVPRLMSDLHHPCVVIKNTEFTRAGRLAPDLCSALAHPSNKQATHHERISSSVDAKWPRAGLGERGFTCFISRKMLVILACFQVSGSCFFMQVSDFYLFVYLPHIFTTHVLLGTWKLMRRPDVAPWITFPCVLAPDIGVRAKKCLNRQKS